MAIGDKIATREAYGDALVEFGAKYENLVVLDADLAEATKTGKFKKAYPDRFFDCGIAEGNMIGIAAGMATTGKIPCASSFASLVITCPIFPLHPCMINLTIFLISSPFPYKVNKKSVLTTDFSLSFL